MLALMLAGTFLETIGVGLVLPAVALMTREDILDKYPALSSYISIFGKPTQENIVIIGMAGLVLVYLIKTLYLALLAWYQSHSVFNIQSRLSAHLFSGYLYQPYTFHLQRNSSQLIHNTLFLVSHFTNVLQQGLLLLTESMVLVGIGLLLLYVEPFGALLVVSIIGIAGSLFHQLTRKRLLAWGDAFRRHEALRIQYLQQGLGGVKELKLYGRESVSIEQYQLHNTTCARLSEYQATIRALPRLWLELLAVVGLAVLVIIMLGQDKPLSSLLPSLGVFAAAAFRLMPSANRVLIAVQSMKFSTTVIDTLDAEVKLIKVSELNQACHAFDFKDRINISQLTYKYPMTEVASLTDINLSIDKGATVGFIGESGAGKSTLVDLILGLLTPDTGTVLVDGHDIRDNLRGWQNLIGYVPQSIYLTDDTLRRNIAFAIPDEQIDDKAVWRAINAAQLDQFIKKSPQGLDTQVGERGVRLSGGQLQRIGIARALYYDPSILVLDEATSSLDTDTERDVMDAVYGLKDNKTIIIVTHRLTTVERCNVLFRLDHGRLIAMGEAAGVLKSVSVN